MEIYKKPNSRSLNSKRDLLAYLTEKIPKSNDWLWFHQGFGTISLRFFWYHSPLFWLYPCRKIIIVTTGFTFIHNIKRKREFTSSGSSLVSQEISLLSSVQSLSRVRLFATPRIAARQASLSITNSRSLLKLMPIESVMPSSHLILSSPSPPAPNPSQHQGLFQWVNSSHEVAKVLEFQLQHQSFQWTPRTYLLQDGLVESPCSPRDSQESSPTPQFFAQGPSKSPFSFHLLISVYQVSHSIFSNQFLDQEMPWLLGLDWASLSKGRLVRNLGSAGKESVCNEGDLGSIPGLGRSPGEGKGYPLQYSGLKNSMDCIVHGVTKSWTQLSSFHFTWLRLGFWPRHCYKDEITVSVRMSCLYCKSQWYNSKHLLLVLTICWCMSAGGALP